MPKIEEFNPSRASERLGLLIIYNKRWSATRRNAAQARALRELRCANTITLGTLAHFRLLGKL